MAQPSDHQGVVATPAAAAEPAAADCCQPVPTTADPRWLRAAHYARALSWVSLAWMTAEGVLGLVAGLQSGSISLLGWALGSDIEGLASVIVIWRFTGTRTLSETAEGRAQKAVAVSFFLLAPYLAIEALRDLAGAHLAHTSTLGVIVTAVSLAFMPALGVAKKRLGTRWFFSMATTTRSARSPAVL